MEPWMWVVLVVAGIVFLVFLAGRGSSGASVSEAEKQRIRNTLVEKMNKDTFLLRYPRNHRNDFEGAFVIHNSTQQKWFASHASQVHYAIMEIFTGNIGPSEICRDASAGDFFSVRIVQLAGSGYNDRGQLQRALKATYAAGKKQY